MPPRSPLSRRMETTCVHNLKMRAVGGAGRKETERHRTSGTSPEKADSRKPAASANPSCAARSSAVSLACPKLTAH